MLNSEFLNKFLMVFDVESLGLYGQGFAFGYTVVKPLRDWALQYKPEDGSFAEYLVARGEWEKHCYYYPSTQVSGYVEDHAWVAANVKFSADFDNTVAGSLPQLRELFWRKLQYWKSQSALICAETSVPVESNFIAACVADQGASAVWGGPYPLIDIGSIREYLGLPSIDARYPSELPVHNPLADARQSARLLVEAILVSTGVSLKSASLPSGGL